MLRLNDDCLCLIFDRLELRDQITLTAVCKRFRDTILAVQWRSRFRHFDLNKHSQNDVLSRQHFESLFRLIAHRIERLVIWERTFTNREWAFFLHFKFPVLRRLECQLMFNEGDMQLLAAHCPLIKQLYLYNIFETNSYSYIVRMRHLRVLHLSRCMLKVCDFQQILTLPLTELSVFSFDIRDNSRSVAETLIGASHLRVFRMHFYEATPGVMKSIVELVSTTETRIPLTVYINYGIFPYTVTINDDSDEVYDCPYDNFKLFKEFMRSLKALSDSQMANRPHTILFSKYNIECRFFLPIE